MMRALEIGSGRGDTTLVLATNLPSGGLLIGMEADGALAAAARIRLRDAGHAERVSVIVGEPVRFLHKVSGPFDLIVVNISGIPEDKVKRLLAPGGVVVTNHATIMVNDMTIAEWLTLAKADAEKRGLSELLPMLDGLAKATEQLRAADWNDPSTPSSALLDADDSAQGRRGK